MTRITYYILSILILTSCKEKNPSGPSANSTVTTNEVLKLNEVENKTDSKVIITCYELSKSMIDLIGLLEQDNYEVEIKEQQNDLLFQSKKRNNEFEVDEKISFSKTQYLSMSVKRKNKLEGRKDYWYPSFSVTEICSQDEATASKNHDKILEIINNNDIFNEKNYDYILKNENKLIYVSCGAKIFTEYALAYKEKIEELVKNNKR